MRAIIYGYNPETEDWVELLNKGDFWIKMNGITFMLKKAMRLSKKHKMKTYLSMEKEGGKTALLPLSLKFKLNGILLSYENNYEQSSEWRMRKTIPNLKLINNKTYWTNKHQFNSPLILSLNLMDIFIEHWASFKRDHIKTISDFIINAATEMSGPEVLEEAKIIMSNPDSFNEFYEELKPLGIKKETYKVASKKYSDFLKKNTTK
ncbi:hypothetical protein [Mycoplasma todarodis]|uniref:hypothetical protein n=1 Tax=Mycoplasma todarodis TaxID=1937191 RepID=UPI003B3701F2